MLPQGTLSEGNVPFTFAEVTRQALYAGMLCYTNSRPQKFSAFC